MQPGWDVCACACLGTDDMWVGAGDVSVFDFCLCAPNMVLINQCWSPESAIDDETQKNAFAAK